MRLIGCAAFVACVAISSARPLLKPRCVPVGQWYNVEDRQKLPWVGLRVANIRAADQLALILHGGDGIRRFALPFTTKANKGSHWVRVNLEKTGWDFVFVEAPLNQRSGECDWAITAPGGKHLLGGKINFQAKSERPFAPPHPREANQRNHPGKPRPKHR